MTGERSEFVLVAVRFSAVKEQVVIDAMWWLSVLMGASAVVTWVASRLCRAERVRLVRVPVRRFRRWR